MSHGLDGQRRERDKVDGDQESEDGDVGAGLVEQPGNDPDNGHDIEHLVV